MTFANFNDMDDLRLYNAQVGQYFFSPATMVSGLGFKTYLPTGVRVCEFGSRLLWEPPTLLSASYASRWTLILGATSETTEQGRRHTEKLNGSENSEKAS